MPDAPPDVLLELTVDAARAALADDPDVPADLTDAELTAALAAVDIAALYEAERATWTVQVWDRSSPINGVDAATILAARDDIPDKGDVYLLYRDGALSYFQPHLPGAAGLESISVGSGATVGAEHADTLAAGAARAAALRQVRNHLTAVRAATPG
jgi:hypothetical protein